MELPLFAPFSFHELLLRRGTDNLDVRLNSRMKRSWRVKINGLSGKRTLTVPSLFEDAPDAIKEALVEWALLAPQRKHKKNAAFLQRKKQLEHIIWEYVASSGKKTERVVDIASYSFQTAGRLYDLREVFDCMNVRYFDGKLTSHVRWNKSSRRSYQTSFSDPSGQRHNLISIARAYNRPDVPRFAIEAIMYHEMLHIAIPPFKRNLHNVIHGSEFKRAERSFPHFKEWRHWEKTGMKTI
jgi:hypothetical protein